MNITWKITKKRGNWRPVLEVTLSMEDWEQVLALPEQIEVSTNIPKPPNGHEKMCLPGKFERHPDYRTKTGHIISIRTLCTAYTWQGVLPWRPGARPEYPEVEEGMRQLRKEIERHIREAYDSEGLEIGGELGLSEETKRHVAPGVAARRMLKVVGGQDAGYE